MWDTAKWRRFEKRFQKGGSVCFCLLHVNIYQSIDYSVFGCAPPDQFPGQIYLDNKYSDSDAQNRTQRCSLYPCIDLQCPLYPCIDLHCPLHPCIDLHCPLHTCIDLHCPLYPCRLALSTTPIPTCFVHYTHTNLHRPLYPYRLALFTMTCIVHYTHADLLWPLYTYRLALTTIPILTCIVHYTHADLLCPLYRLVWSNTCIVHYTHTHLHCPLYPCRLPFSSVPISHLLTTMQEIASWITTFVNEKLKAKPKGEKKP